MDDLFADDPQGDGNGLNSELNDPRGDQPIALTALPTVQAGIGSANNTSSTSLTSSTSSSTAWLLPRFLQRSDMLSASQCLALITGLSQRAPLRQFSTPGGKKMSVASSNCGELGWVSDRRGYRYSSTDPLSDQPWPAIPQPLFELAQQAALAAGFADFQPQACLINRYQPGDKMALHQDKDEQALDAPIVSLSLGLSARFLWGGNQRKDKPEEIWLHHGDMLVWGGADRLRFHGIKTLLKQPAHPVFGLQRFNLTFRRVH